MKGSRRASIPLVIAMLLIAGSWTVAPVAAVEDATTTTLTVSPAGQAAVGQTVTFEVEVGSTSGAVPQGSVHIMTGGICGMGSPVASAPLDAAGTATLTHVFDAPLAYSFAACFFAAAGSGFLDSETDYQPYSIVATVPPEVTLHPIDATAVLGETVSFMAGATGLPAPTVQWQVQPATGGDWANLDGETNTTLEVVATAQSDGNRYRAVFTNGAPPDATTTAAALRLTLGFDGFFRPLPRTKVTAGRSIPVRFSLASAAGVAATPSLGATARVSLWSSSSGGAVATAGCTFDASTAVYACHLRLPSTLARGATYWIAAEVSFGTGPWTLVQPIPGARTGNPTPITIR